MKHFFLALAIGGFFHPCVAFSGDVDRNFGNGGRVITDFFGATDVGNNLIIDKKGKILIAGSATKQSISDHFALVRCHENGSLDTSFGNDGRTHTRSISTDKVVSGGIMGLGLLSNGTLITCGRGQYLKSEGLALVAYRDDGTLDRSYFGDGALIIGDEDSTIYPLALTIDDSDRIIVAASAFHNSNTASFAIFRFTKDGSLDQSFGTRGKIIHTITSGRNVPRALSIDKLGNIVVGGFNGNSKFVVVRYRVDGTLDQAFGSNGVATIEFNPGGTDTLHALAIQPDGKILVGGDVQVGNFGDIRMIDFGLARLNSNGQLDLSFNKTGKQITYFSKPAGSSLWALALQDDGKIIAVGDDVIAKALAVARFREDGTPDDSFADRGKQIIPFEKTCHWEAVALHADQKIVIGGYLWNGKHYDMAITRLLNDGTKE
jgi:uncharacterized delta-60 repeat protein